MSRELLRTLRHGCDAIRKLARSESVVAVHLLTPYSPGGQQITKRAVEDARQARTHRVATTTPRRVAGAFSCWGGLPFAGSSVRCCGSEGALRRADFLNRRGLSWSVP